MLFYQKAILSSQVAPGPTDLAVHLLLNDDPIALGVKDETLKPNRTIRANSQAGQ